MAVVNPSEFEAGALSLASDDFSLFGLPKQYALDTQDLSQRWKSLQAKTHPDQFATQGAAAQRLATQWSVRVNEAYQRLKNPIGRAAYLCNLHGEALGAENNTAMPSSFLMQQMQWREELEDAETENALDALNAEVQSEKNQLLQTLAAQLDSEHDYKAAVGSIRMLMFIEKMESEIEKKIDGIVTNF